jgi:ABC-2 type transport system permease protein
VKLNAVRIVEPLIDAAVAALCYLLAYRLLFSGSTFANFVPYALATVPLVAASQVGVFAALMVYRGHRAGAKLARLLLGTIAGTALAALLTWQIHGFIGVSRSAFSAYLVLFAVASIGWRIGRILWRSSVSVPAADEIPGMVDRATERATLKGTLTSLLGYRELIKNLVLRDLKLKYRGSLLGFVWSLVNPLMMIAVYTVAFTYIIRIRVEGFVFFVMLGTLAWSFFSSSASMSTGAVVDSGGLMKSVTFPRAILPIATVLFNLAQHLLTVTVILPIMLLVNHVSLSPAMLLYPFFLVLQLLFTIGVAFVLAAGTAFFRDVRHLLDIALSALFWMTPILYPLSQVPERMRPLILLTPVSPFIVAYQQIFYYGQLPDLMVWIVAMIYGVAMFLVGVWLFLSVEDQLVEQM